MFCRNCGKEQAVTPDKTCKECGTNTVKATSFCRYCGKPTSPQDLTCPTCGSAIKPIPGSVKALNKENPKLIKLGKIVNLTIVAIIVTAYIVFSLPPKVTKPVKAAASDAMVAATGYTALPLTGISAYPTTIPPLRSVENFYMPVGVNINATQQLTVYAVYKNTVSDNATKATRLEVVTDKAVFQSSNDKIATVNGSGFVRARALGAANITVSYTAVPGSANFTTAADGKTPITVAVIVPVLVTGPPVAAPAAPVPGT